ncbi:MAG: HD domain-containing protein [Alphaproteobacteria bacterium]|nr:HD domain-containing protein [Alphaproteobacteria bacterium]
MDLGTVGFSGIERVTQSDWDIIIRHHEAHYAEHLPLELLGMVERLKGPMLGFQVDRFEHSLQTATRALRAGADEETIVVALLHDIGDLIAPENHCDIAAGVLKPYVSKENHWLIQHHVYFSGYYFFHFSGLDRNLHKQFLGHPAYAKTKHFVEAWDGPSFDPKYDTLPLDVFEPMLRRVLARAPRSQWRETHTAA